MESKQKIKEKIRKLWEGISSDNRRHGHTWYDKANSWLWDVVPPTNTDYRIIAAVCAVLSPSVAWEDNKKQTKNLIHAYQLTQNIDGVVLTTYKNQIKKALKILGNQHLIHCPDRLTSLIGRRAFKTIAFYRNIAYPKQWQYVTIDRHIFAALKIKQLSGNESQYRTIEEAFVYVAAQLGIVPCELQAAIWYINHLIHRSQDYYRIWIRTSHDQIDSAYNNSFVPHEGRLNDLINQSNLRLCFSSSVQDGGVRLKLIDLEPKKWDFISCDGNLEMEQDAIRWCEQQVDRKYDLLGLGGFVFCHLKLFKPSRKKAWCSEITEDTLYQTFHLHGDRTSVRQCPKAKWYRPPSPVALWNRVKKLTQPLESLVWTT